MVYDMGSSSMDQIQSNDRPVWDMLPGDVAQRLAEGKMTATSVPKGAKRRCESQGQERHQGEPAKMNTELIPKHNNPIGRSLPYP